MHSGVTAHSISDRMLFTAIMVACNFVFFMLHSFFFFYCDHSGYLRKYAIRDPKHLLPSSKLYMKAMRDICFDGCLMKPILAYLVFPYMQPYISFTAELPAVRELVCTVLLMQASYSTTFFVVHWLFHEVPLLYRLVHKQHHEFHESVGVAGQYFHPVEMAFSIVHVAVPTLVFRPHIVVVAIFVSLTFIEIVDAHCGYDVPWKGLYLWSDVYPWGSGARGHDYHHSHNKGMYGVSMPVLCTAVAGMMPTDHYPHCVSCAWNVGWTAGSVGPLIWL